MKKAIERRNEILDVSEKPFMKKGLDYTSIMDKLVVR